MTAILKIRALFVAQSLGCLLVGLLVYLSWRSPNLRLFSWLEPVQPQLSGFGNAIAGTVTPPPDWVVFSLPSVLWCYSFTLTLGAVWLAGSHSEEPAWLLVPLVLVVGIEAAQSLGALIGTFDVVDLLLPAPAWLLAIFIVRRAETSLCAAP